MFEKSAEELKIKLIHDLQLFLTKRYDHRCRDVIAEKIEEMIEIFCVKYDLANYEHESRIKQGMQDE